MFALTQAARSSGFSRELWLVVLGSFAGVVLAWLAELARETPSVAARTTLLAMLTVSLIAISALYWRDVLRPPPPYSFSGDTLATFTSGKGGPARTDLGHAFSILSDNVHNGHSKAWYERIYEPDSQNGFLRFHYELEPIQGVEAFVGLFADFTLPPARPVDMSSFSGLSVRLRLAQAAGNSPELRVVLFSDNARNEILAYPTAVIRASALGKEWRSFSIPFEEFGAPPFVSFQVELDRRRVFRIALALVCDKAVHGHLDVDDIRLFGSH